MVFGNLGNMGEMVSKAREMQKRLKEIKQELKKTTYEAEHKGVKVRVNGELEVENLEIEGEINLKHIKEAVNHGLKKAQKDAESKIKGLTGGVSIPGLF